MDRKDLKLIESHLKKDRELEELYKEHLKLEQILAKLDSKLFLNQKEEVERKDLQKKKLLGKDRMEIILKKYRHEGAKKSYA